MGSKLQIKSVKSSKRFSSAVTNAVMRLEKRVLFSTIANAEAATTGTFTLGNTSAGDPAMVVTEILSQPGTVNGKSYSFWEFLVNDGTGSAEIYSSSSTLPGGYVPTVGDNITATGAWSFYDNIPELSLSGSGAAISQYNSGNAVPAPIVETIPDVNVDSLPNNIEGYFVTLKGVTISGLTTPGITNQTASISDGTNSMTLYYWPTSYGSVSNQNLFGETVPTGTANITGLATVYSGTSPEFVPYLIDATPLVTAVAPNQGGIGGGTSVTISGQSFTTASAVKFGNLPATSFKVNSDRSITAVAPAGSGTVDITVTNDIGTSPTATADQYTYTLAPTVSSVSPTGGPTTGGTTVTISGSNLGTGDTVKFGTLSGTGVTYNAANHTLTAVSPAESAGTVDVTVNNSSGQISSTSTADQFTYALPPTVSGLYNISGGISTANTETSGIDSGGDQVVIAGTNLDTASAVTFGGVPAESFAYNTSLGAIVAVSPKNPAGTVADVVVTNPAGSSPVSSADQFTYTLTTIAGTQSPNLAPASVFTIDTAPVISQILEIAGATVSDAGGNTETYNDTAFYIEDSTGSEDIFQASLPNGYVPVTGNTISVTADESPYQGTPEIGGVSAISNIGTAPIPAPVVTTIPQANTSSPLSTTIDGYIVTIKGVYISGLTSGGSPLTTFGLNQTSSGGLITDTAGNQMSLYYGTKYDQAAVDTPLDSVFAGSIVGNLDGASVPTGNLVDVTGWVDINNSGVTELNIISITNPTTLAPIITSLNPAKGPPGGTNTVTINGYGFLNPSGALPTVSFGGNAGTNVQVLSDNQLQVTAPASTLGSPGHLGTVNLTVSNENGPSNIEPYAYTTAPVVSGVSPGGANTAGLNASGGVQSVVITGSGFTGASSVSFGGTTLTSGFVVNSDSQITVTAAPPHAAGSVDVTVTAGGVVSSTSSFDKFIYDGLPTVSISPSSGADNGGTKVIISGSNLLGVTNVSFGSISLPASSFSYNAANGTITATSPAGTYASTVNVTVTNYAGTSSIVAADKFTYTATTVAFAQSVNNGVTVTIDSNPVITAILSQPGTVNGQPYSYYAFLINDGTGSEDVFYNPTSQYSAATQTGNPAVAAFIPVVGNTIQVTGQISNFRDIDEIGGSGNFVITSIFNTGTAAVPAPIPETVSVVNVSSGSLIPQGTGWGSHLITLSNVTVTGQSGNVVGTANQTLTVADSTGSMVLYLYNSSYSTTNEQFTGAPFPAGPETLTGFVYYYSSSQPNAAEFVPVLDNSTIPAWLAPSSQGIFNSAQKTLYLNGTSTIISDPGTDNPVILAPNTNNSGSVLNIAVPTSGHIVHIGGLNLTANATVNVKSSTGTPTTVVDANQGGLTFDSSSVLNLNSNFLDIQNSPSLLQIDTLLAAGSNGGLWTGTTGITSTSAASDPAHLKALGAILNTNAAGGTLYSTFGGAPTGGANDVLIRYTYVGDANLDGKVDGSDYSEIDSGFASGATPSWGTGDFNYDGSIDGSDYTLIDNSYNRQGSPLAGPLALIAAPAQSTSVVSTPDFFFSKKKISSSLIGDVQGLISN